MRVALILVLVLLAPLSMAAQSIPDDRARAEAVRAYRAGQEFLSGEHWERAAREFQSAIKSDYLLTDAYYGLGQAFMGLERYVSAAQAFEGCLTTARTVHGLREQGRVMGDRRIDDEIREVRDAIRRLLTNGGSVLRAQRLESHLDYLHRSRSSMGATFQPPPIVLLALGSAHYRNGGAARAEYYWKEAARGDDTLGEAWNNLAAIYAATGRSSEAKHALTSAERAGFRVNPKLKEEILGRQ
ncbi:MAG TPA: tetratricopeptide repeat protein [Vicinamibacterales bacterium]|nr:tetratricopeptide repeat protein [Vicinamibacterales bacterium]